MPDTSTLAYLRDFKSKMMRLGNRMVTNDTVTICAGSFCTTYTMTDSGDFMGGGTMNNTPPGGGSGGSGGGEGGNTGSGGRGTNLGGSGGCVRNCTGTVTVKPFRENPR